MVVSRLVPATPSTNYYLPTTTYPICLQIALSPPAVAGREDESNKAENGDNKAPTGQVGRPFC